LVATRHKINAWRQTRKRSSFATDRQQLMQTAEKARAHYVARDSFRGNHTHSRGLWKLRHDTIKEFNAESKAECDQLNLVHVTRKKALKRRN